MEAQPAVAVPVEPLPDSLEAEVLRRLRDYAQSLQGVPAADLYALIMPQLERPLVRVAMELSDGCQVKAASMLGIHRNTLRKRLAALGLPKTQYERAREPAGKPD